jgi:hypothetical protein
MIFPALLVLYTNLALAASDSVPVLNVQQVCQGIAQQGGVSFHDTDVADEKKNCLDSESAVRDQLVKQWSSFSAPDKSACTKESEMGGESSYTELLTCLEMARDVRNIHNDADTSTPTAPRGLSAPTGHRQPTSQ